jgi:ABC-type uncharacterized transport system permease subunit
MSKSWIVKKTLRGLGLASAATGGTWYVIPLATAKSPATGLVIGIIAGVVTLAVYGVIAIARKTSDPGS